MKRRRKQEMSIREPESLVLSEFDVLHKYNWYRQNFTDKDAKQFLLNYARTEKQRKNINSQTYLPFSYCWCARLISNGNTLPEDLVRRLDSFIEKLQKEVRPTKKVEPVVRVSTERRNENRTYDAYAYLENQIEELFDTKGKKEITAQSILTIYELNKSQSTEIAEMLDKDHLSDLRNIQSDEDVKEAYSFLTRRQQNLIFKNLKQVKEELLSVKSVVTEQKKKKRAVRLKPVEELIRKLKFSTSVFEFPQIDMKHLIGKRVVSLASQDKRSLIRLESKSGIETRSAFLTNIDRAEKIVVYGKNLESAIRYLAKSKHELMAKKLSKHVIVRRMEEIELKNNEYRSTDKFCVFQAFIDL